jgi:hypothetical protein
MRDDINQRYDADTNEPPFPTKVTVAGIAWIVFGGLIVVNILILLVLLAANTGGGGPGERDRTSEFIGVGLCLSILLGLFAAGFIFVGVQSVRGTAPGTVANGVGSIIFGLLNFIPLVALLVRASAPGRFPPSVTEYIQGAISFFFGMALIAVGILALVGSPEYKVWRQFQKAKERWEYDRQYRRQRRRREELDEEDDRPRRGREEPEEDLPPRRRREDDDAGRIQRRPRQDREDD